MCQTFPLCAATHAACDGSGCGAREPVSNPGEHGLSDLLRVENEDNVRFTPGQWIPESRSGGAYLLHVRAPSCLWLGRSTERLGWTAGVSAQRHAGVENKREYTA